MVYNDAKLNFQEIFGENQPSHLTHFRPMFYFNPFVPNAAFLYPPLQKTSENHKVFGRFLGVEKGSTGNKWVNILQNYASNTVEKQKLLNDDITLPWKHDGRLF